MFDGIVGQKVVKACVEKVLNASLSKIESFWLHDDGKFLLGNDQPSIADLSPLSEVMQLEVMLDQIGSYELKHILAHSQRLNSDAITSIVKALCKVAMSELQSPIDPRVFSLTTIVEVAHYNMNRIRLVWSCIWNVLSDFFISIGLSENLSVAIFVKDSLAFETMEKIAREYFPFTTETEPMNFTGCVRCLITFTSSRFNSEVSLNAIAFLRSCTSKLAEVGLVCNEDRKDACSYILAGTEGGFDGHGFTTKELGALNKGAFAGTRGNEWSFDKYRR
ncbi:hypothetical protein Nepgr_017185 [Nepenthes gracilis]|uniref:Uncharacterized protein n=1 Tax=Nepenthes gracilis TaxID=150966 RepID=A0AAD3XSV5_NEPGR|nr:hypothetical protein Nepgr_017185 [Nepenthes gracilis]